MLYQPLTTIHPLPGKEMVKFYNSAFSATMAHSRHSIIWLPSSMLHAPHGAHQRGMTKTSKRAKTRQNATCPLKIRLPCRNQMKAGGWKCLQTGKRPVLSSVPSFSKLDRVKTRPISVKKWSSFECSINHLRRLTLCPVKRMVQYFVCVLCALCSPLPLFIRCSALDVRCFPFPHFHP